MPGRSSLTRQSRRTAEDPPQTWWLPGRLFGLEVSRNSSSFPNLKEGEFTVGFAYTDGSRIEIVSAQHEHPGLPVHAREPRAGVRGSPFRSNRSFQLTGTRRATGSLPARNQASERPASYRT
jgi:hypothetical protein